MKERQEGKTDDVLHIIVSIHAPVKERQGVKVQGLGGIVSIHAPVKERHTTQQSTQPPAQVSIHAPVKERLTRGLST